MYIAIKKRSNRASESLVVFEFTSQEEADDFFAGMNKFIENDGIPQKFKEMMAEPLKRLESRCDDKQFFTRRNGGITDALRSSMMRSILTVAMERNEAVRNYLMVGLTVTTRKIPKICISTGYKK